MAVGHWVDDPNGINPPRWEAGFDPEQGQSVEGPGVHTSKKRLLWEQGRNFLVPAGVMGADALLGAVVNAGTTAGAGAAPSAVAGGASAGGVGGGLASSAAAPALGVPVGSTLVPGSVAATTGAGLSAAPAAASIAAPVAATAGGGLLSKLTPTLLGDASKALQGFSASQTNNRDADLAAQRDYEDQQLAMVRQQNESALTDLQQRKYLSDEAQRNRGNAVHGGYLSGVQDVNITPPPGINMVNITGGLRPSAISGKEQIGNTIQAQAMKDLINPPALPPVGNLPPAPQAPKGAGAVETGTGIASAILPWLSPILRQYQTPTPVAPPKVNVGSGQFSS